MMSNVLFCVFRNIYGLTCLLFQCRAHATLTVCMCQSLTDYLSSDSIIVIGAKLIQVQSLICRGEKNYTN